MEDRCLIRSIGEFGKWPHRSEIRRGLKGIFETREPHHGQ
jgi:hypothetical protein